MPLPVYYSTLAPFEKKFRAGRAILTYHHVGPRRAGARLKGLYVSRGLFAKQMGELKTAGFAAGDYSSVVAPGAPEGSQVWITFDDGFVDVFQNALSVLAERRFRAIQFLVSELIGKTNEWQQREGDVEEKLMDAGQVREWMAAGNGIGCHTLTHPRLTRLPLAQAREEITASKKSLEDRFGISVEHFCYPYGDWNRAVRHLVAEAGYRSACITEPGINCAGESPFELKRFTARYPSRNFKAIWRRIFPSEKS